MAGRRGNDRGVRAQVDSGAAELRPDPERRRGWTLLLDGTPQSHVDLDDPTHLEFDYVRRLGHVVDLAAPPRRPMRVLHMGGGAFTLARYVAATRPRSGQQVVELDGALVELVRRELPLDRSWRVRVRTGDAREVVGRLRDAFDLVVLDVFAGARTPAHLVSTEFLEAVAEVLAPTATYAANLTDGGALAFARGQVATLQAVFPHTCLVADPAVLRGRRFGNLLLVGSRNPLPVDLLTARAAGDRSSGRLLHGPELDRFRGGARPVHDAAAAASPLPPAGTFEPGR
ncbi:spermine/spermidine synthase [Pseudonocardia cypriaca]|uniref:Spermine/spermidine synthase n=1 Tax=Pseudonocardia cypriaca TaxID=882449 RepID=A0A543G9S2_9PSEU|nr:spermine/spermidine synthase [Pseudonocardia cypriaca]